VPILLFISTGGRLVFGAAKPVPINYWALKNPRRDIIWIGLAGPLANFIFAFLLSLLAKSIPLSMNLRFAVLSLIVINVVLGVFNLIPIPPLDGSRILMGILPRELANSYARIEPFAFIILIILISLGGLNWIVWPLVDAVLRLIGVSY
jgi:Zn-dependent protease